MAQFGLPSNGIRSTYRPAARLGAPGQTTGFQQIATDIAPFISALAQKSATEQVEVLQAKIENQRRLRDAMPEPIRTIYANNVRVMEAKLKAARQAKVLEREGQNAQRTWRLVGYTITGTGVAVGGAMVVALLSLSRMTDRKHRGGSHE